MIFAWQGGEPTLMGLDFFRKAISYQIKYRKPGVTIENAIQTNGTALDDAWGAFFREHNFLVRISIDGPQKCHDAYRVDRGGRPTFEKVMRGLDILKKHGVEFNVLTTVHAGNVDHPIEVYRFLRNVVKTQFIQFIPIVEPIDAADKTRTKQVSDRSVNAEKFGKFLVAVFEEWVRRDVGKLFVQMFDVALGAWMGRPGGLCVFTPACGRALAMEHNGDVYACDHFVAPEYRLGNIMQTPLVAMAGSAQQLQFGMDKQAKLPRTCLECEVLFACQGGCPKDRIIRTADGEAGLNYLCNGFKAFFQHIDIPMKRMASLLKHGQAQGET